MTAPIVSYTTRSDATPEDELRAVAAVYRFVIGRRAKEGDSTTDAAPVGHREGVSHVEQRSE